MSIISLYLLIIGIGLLLISLAEFMFPARAYRIWNGYVSSKVFFLHGVFLIGGGFPLVMYRGALSTVIFIVGVIVILTGPFIILYPDKVRRMFSSLENEMDKDGLKRVVYFDAAVRFTLGIIFCASYFL